MTKRRLRKTLIGIAIVIALIIIARLLLWALVSVEKRANHPKVMRIISQDLTFEEETLEEQLSLALNWFNRRHLSDSDKGRLCERISLIYRARGDELAYYRYLGYALYFLEQSGEKDYSVNIYLDLANFYLNNYSFDSAQRMIDSAMELESFDTIENLQKLVAKTDAVFAFRKDVRGESVSPFLGLMIEDIEYVVNRLIKEGKDEKN